MKNAAVAFGIMLLGAGTMSAQVVLDQTFTMPSALGWEFQDNYVAQTFTAGVTGRLVGIRVGVSLWQVELPIQVSIRSCQDGVPNDSVLTEMVLPPGVPADRLESYIELNEPITVVEGTQYALVLNVIGAVYGESPGLWTGAVDYYYDTDYYPGGELLFSHDGIVFQPYPWSGFADLHFQTYVDLTPDVKKTIEELIDDLHELVAKGEIGFGRGRSLIAELEVALWFLEFDGGEWLAAVRLDLFIKKVENMIRHDAIDPNLGEELLIRAREILELLQ